MRLIFQALKIFNGYINDKISKDKKVVVHCMSGDRSSIAASLLLAKGFDNIINLTGGFMRWRQEGFGFVSNVEEKRVA